jgi:hypothetical protein
MQDIYAAMMGEPISEEEKMQALARKLAVQRSVGQTGQILGGRMLQAPAAQMINAADESAAKLAGYSARKRELMAQEQMARMNDEAQAKAAELDRQFRANEAAKERAFRANESAQQRALSRALAAEKGLSQDYRKFSSKDIQTLSEKKEEIDEIQSVISGFKPEYAGTGFPGGRAISNAIASRGLGTESMKDAQKWWMDWERAYTLPTRNKMFGSALTAPERKAWNEANITKDMTPEQIQTNISVINELRQKAVERMGNSFKVEGFNPETVDSLFGPSAEEIVMGSKSRAAAKPTAKPAKTLEEYSIEELDSLSDEELRALLGGG